MITWKLNIFASFFTVEDVGQILMPELLFLAPEDLWLQSVANLPLQAVGSIEHKGTF